MTIQALEGYANVLGRKMEVDLIWMEGFCDGDEASMHELDAFVYLEGRVIFHHLP